MIGGEISFLNVHQGSYNETAFSFGPTLGFYFVPNQGPDGSAGRTFPYLRASYLYRSLSNGNSVTGASIGIRLGSVLMLSRNIGLDMGVSFSSDRESHGRESINGTTLLVGAGITTFVW